MTFELWLSSAPGLPILPAQFAWAAVLTLLVAFAFARSVPRREEIRASWVWASLLCLLLAVPAGGLAVVRFPATGAATVAGVPLAAVQPAGGLLCIALILLAAALLGKLPALGAGLVVGAVRSVFDTHQAATILEYALAGWAIAECVRQNYAGRLFALLRRPWGAALAASLFLILLRFGGELGSARGDAVTLFDYALGRLPGFLPAVLCEGLAGAVIVEAVRLALPSLWPSPKQLRRTRYDRWLAWKISLWLILPIFLMAVTLTAIVAVDSRDQARQTLRQKVLGVAGTAQTELPVALTTGHTLLEGMGAGLPSREPDPSAITAFLGERLSQPPFFEQIAFLAPDGSILAAYPPDADPFCQSVEEAQGCSLALRGIAWEGWLPPDENGKAWISFTQPVRESDGGIRGALIGRTSLEKNPLLKAIPAAFRSLEGGQGLFLDDADRVLFPSNAEPWIEGPPAERDADGGEWFLGTMPGGGTRLSYLLPLKYPAWKVAIRVPEASAFRTALQTGLHVGLLAFLMALLIEAVALLIAQQITLPLRRLAESAGLIAAGDLERVVAVEGQDEIGRLGRSLEAMRRNLRRQIRDQEILLEAVQGMTSNLDLERSMEILLHSVRTATGADGVRVVLESKLRDRHPGGNPFLGEEGKALEGIDGKILELARAAGEADRRTPWTANRDSGTDEGMFASLPGTIGALVVVRIASATTFYGALAAAFRQPQAFEVGMLDLLTGFANQASLAVTNARLLEGTENERERLAAILEAIPEGVLVVDSEDRVQYANPAAEAMLGSRFLGSGRPLAEGIAQPELASFLMESAVQPRSLEFAGADGRRLQGVVRSVRSADRAGIWQVCVLQDVTSFRQLDELKSEFVHTVSHDLRRPLTMMEGLVHMIEMLGPLNPAQQEYARRIRLSAQQMNRLVQDLLDLGRVESGAEARLAPVDLAAAVGRAVEELKPEAAAGGVKIQVRIPEALPEIPADASLLERALGNLIENGIRFNRPGGTVEVSAELAADSVVVAVKDSGIGIAPADQPRIFEKFFRAAARDDPEHPAWGLGLAIVKSVARWHGGRVWFESKLGQGSTFYLAIPRSTS
jgi:signal transduction histidine kinase/HAMP domain-containing protein